MNTPRDAAQQALDWFDWLHSGQPDHMAGIDTDGVRQSLRAALAEQPAGQRSDSEHMEPVAWISDGGIRELQEIGRTEVFAKKDDECLGTVPLYTAPQPTKPAEQPAKQEPWTPREIELIDGMIQVQLDHAARCDHISNRTMAEKQKSWDMERVALLRKIRNTAPQPVKQPQEPSAGGVLFAVEEAIRNGDCPWQIEQAFDEYEAERRNSIKAYKAKQEKQT